jgi:lipoyl(octanoyl) transferase
MRALAPLGITGERSAGYTGVWTQGRKLASIGVHARDWVTWHGFALNVTTDLSGFELMVPCGIAEVTMTSVAAELGTRAADAATLGSRVRGEVTSAFAAVFGLEAAPLSVPDLERMLAACAA